MHMTETKRPFKLFFTFLVVLICILLLAVGLRSILNSTITMGSAQISTVTPTSFPTEITDAKGVTMRLVPAGDFIMGRDKGLDQEKPAHTVTLDDFYMDVYEVTQARYKECVNSGVCSEPKDVPNIDSFYQEPDHPMTNVDWYQSQTYCEWRGARLPTEAEWEKAARGTDGRTYPWGEEIDSTYADYGDAVGGTSAVGAYEKNISPYGMYDMAGNVWEWTSEPLVPYPGNQGPQNYYRESERALRGGTWYHGEPAILNTTFRYASFPEDEEHYIGFRCAVSADLAANIPVTVLPVPVESVSLTLKMKKMISPIY
jgi:formylglycine-generating enzyme required for sulfatase activity